MPADNTIYIVDDDAAVRKSLTLLLREEGFQVKTYASAWEFLEKAEPPLRGCLLLDVRMPGIDGLQLQEMLPQREIHLPVIMITGHADVPMAVQAMKAGAKDFLEKPFRAQMLLEHIHKTLSEKAQPSQAKPINTSAQLARLTTRERQIFELLVEGKMNKHIAAELKISVRTVEAHRARIMEKLKARSLAELVRLALRQDSSVSG